MDFQSLDDLTPIPINLDYQNYEIFDLSKASFKYVNVMLFTHIVTEDEEMRLDLVCNNLFGDANGKDVIMFLNDITNDLHIKKGDEILYPDSRYIDSFRATLDNGDEIRKTISENRNKKKVDTSRVLYKNKENDKQSLPPSMTETDYNPVTLQDGKIVIGKGILNN